MESFINFGYSPCSYRRIKGLVGKVPRVGLLLGLQNRTLVPFSREGSLGELCRHLHWCLRGEYFSLLGRLVEVVPMLDFVIFKAPSAYSDRHWQ